MGSFRSQPDLNKHTETGQGVGLSYVSTHMCGNLINDFRLENLHVGCTYSNESFEWRQELFVRCIRRPRR